MKHLRAGFSPQQTSPSTQTRIYRQQSHASQSRNHLSNPVCDAAQRYPRPVLVADALRQHHEKRRPQSQLVSLTGESQAGRRRLSIHERPADIEGRVVGTHWEGDLIKAKNRSEVGVLLERKRDVILTKISDAGR
jgi:IS30 family transposase